MRRGAAQRGIRLGSNPANAYAAGKEYQVTTHEKKEGKEKKRNRQYRCHPSLTSTLNRDWLVRLGWPVGQELSVKAGSQWPQSF